MQTDFARLQQVAVPKVLLDTERFALTAALTTHLKGEIEAS